MTDRMVSRDLQVLLKWCRRHADQPGADPLWHRLADEIDAYIHDEQPDPEPDRDQGGLW